MPTNFVTIQGWVHNFVERTTKNGKKVATFSLGFPNLGKKDSFSYVNVTAWDLNKHIANKLSNKWSGSTIVVGLLKQDTWEGDNGKRSEVKVVANQVCLVAPRAPNNSNNNDPAQTRNQAPVNKTTAVTKPKPKPKPEQTQKVQLWEDENWEDNSGYDEELPF